MLRIRVRHFVGGAGGRCARCRNPNPHRLSRIRIRRGGDRQIQEHLSVIPLGGDVELAPWVQTVPPWSAWRCTRPAPSRRPRPRRRWRTRPAARELVRGAVDDVRQHVGGDGRCRGIDDVGVQDQEGERRRRGR